MSTVPHRRDHRQQHLRRLPRARVPLRQLVGEALANEFSAMQVALRAGLIDSETPLSTSPKSGRSGSSSRHRCHPHEQQAEEPAGRRDGAP